MKATIEHDGIIWTGELTRSGEFHKQAVAMPISSKNLYKKNSTKWCLYELVHSDGFFDNHAIRTTVDIVKRIKLKFDRKVKKGNAVRDFFKFARDGHLNRDQTPDRGRGQRGVFIWFLPSTPKEKVENFKQHYKGE